MVANITIGFDTPQAPICALLSRFGLDTYHIYVDNHSPDMIISVTDTYLKVEKQQLNFPIIFDEFINLVKKASYEHRK